MASVSVYTDGSCLNNGNPNARAGIGIFFGVDSPRNISRGLGPKETNNTAEVKAILAAIAELNTELTRGDQVTIYTDSTYAIRVCGEYGENMSKRGWKTTAGQPIPNAELVEEAWNTCRQWPNLHLTHVYGHSDDDDPHSIGNNWADRLAVVGAGGKLRVMRTPSRSRRPTRPPLERAPSRPGRAAAMQEGRGGGCVGGAGAAAGTVAGTTAAGGPSRERGLPQDVVWLAVPFAQKDQAKAIGARWQPAAKMWYVPAYTSAARRAELVRRWGRSD